MRRSLLLLCVTMLGCGSESFDIAASDTTPLEIDSASSETQIVADGEPDVVVEEVFADAADDTRVVVDAVPDAITDVVTDAIADGDALISCDVPIPCYPDADGDGYAPADAKPVNACVCGKGFTTRSPAVTIDCNDEDPRVYPGSMAYYGEAYCVPGTSCTGRSFDYNCSGVEEKQTPGPIFGGCTGACVGTAGWSGTVPACGIAGTWVTCKLEVTGCKQPSVAAKQNCR
jgi:hypothetical protein